MSTVRYGPLDAVTESVRSRAIADLRLLDTPPEEEFDEVVRLAAELCSAPISLITLLEGERQFHKAAHGMNLQQMPREQGFCHYTVQQDDLFILSDPFRDSRFSDNTQVRELGVQFYAGVPLVTGQDIAVGALCILDVVPRTLTELQMRTLRVLGRQVSAQLQLRAHATAMEVLALEQQSQRELFRCFLDSMPVEAYLKNEEGALLFYNRRLAERHGLKDGEWLGKTNEDLLPPDEARLLRCDEDFVLQSNQSHESYVEQAGANGTASFWKLVRTPIRTANGETMLANVGIDLTAELRREAALQQAQDELEEANRKLRSLSLTDDLTRLWNRRAFDARLETEVYRAQYEGKPLSLLMIDVDNFKQLNDDHGHSHGDEVLRQLASVLQHAVREGDAAARFGGEEFAVILPGSPVDGAKAMCRRISEDLKGTPWAQREVTVSIGIALLLPGSNADELLDMADEAMYRAKRSGKNCAVAYEVEAPASA